MSEEKRRILDMVEQGTITQEDAARLLEALGENEPAPAQPQESSAPMRALLILTFLLGTKT